MNLLALHNIALKKVETAGMDLTSEMREFYLLGGWARVSLNTPAEELKYCISVSNESGLRYEVVRPATRWLAFKARSVGEYGGPEQQRLDILAADEHLAGLDISGAQWKQFLVRIPGNIQWKGYNAVKFVFQKKEINPSFMEGRLRLKAGERVRRDNPYKAVAGYFTDMKIFISDEQPAIVKVEEKPERIRPGADNESLLQLPNSELCYGFQPGSDAVLSLEGEIHLQPGGRDDLTAAVMVRSDKQPEWREIWSEQFNHESNRTGDSFAADIPLRDYAMEPAEFCLAVYSSDPDSQSLVIWKRLELTDSGERRPPPANNGGSKKLPREIKNAIIIVFDATRYDFLGCYGNDEGITPNIDNFASGSLLFRQAVATAPYTIASVSSMFSGLLPEQHGMRDNLSVFPEELESMPQAFRRKGYYTLAMAGLPFITRKYGITGDFEHVEYLRDEQDVENERSTMNLDLIRKRIAEAAESGKPVFIYSHLLPPHYPYNPPAPFDTKFIEAGKQTFRDRRRTRSLVGGRNEPSENDELENYILHYKNNLAYADYLFGEMLAALKSSGLYENSLIILTADHAEAFGEHGTMGHTSNVYDEMIRVPLIVHHPGIKSGVEEQQVGLVDLFPTLDELFGLEAKFGGIAGRSIAPLFLREEQESNDYYYSRAKGQKYKFSLRGRRFKYIFSNYLEEFYDLNADPLEKKNLADRYPGLVATLRTRGMLIATSPPIHEISEVTLTDEQERELRNLGYLQ